MPLPPSNTHKNTYYILLAFQVHLSLIHKFQDLELCKKKISEKPIWASLTSVILNQNPLKTNIVGILK